MSNRANHAGEVPREPDGKWKEGYSANPDGPPTGHVKMAHWLRLYLSGKDISHAPAKAREFIEAHFDDPDAGKLKLVWTRHDGPEVLKVEGLSESDLRTRLSALAGILKAKIPAEYHAAIGEAMMAALGDDDGG